MMVTLFMSVYVQELEYVASDSMWPAVRLAMGRLLRLRWYTVLHMLVNSDEKAN